MAPPVPPIATTVDATNITGTSATLNALGDSDRGGDVTVVQFNVGSDESLGTVIPGTPSSWWASRGTVKSISAELTGLIPGTTYYFALYLRIFRIVMLKGKFYHLQPWEQLRERKKRNLDFT